MASIESQIADITQQSYVLYVGPNDLGAFERDKVAALTADMQVRGWVGAPILVAEGQDAIQALTGTHRIAAWKTAHDNADWASEGRFDTIPVVHVDDLCAEFGLDWDRTVAEHSDTTWWDAVRALQQLLPPEVVDYLGIDLQ